MDVFYVFYVFMLIWKEGRKKRRKVMDRELGKENNTRMGIFPVEVGWGWGWVGQYVSVCVYADLKRREGRGGEERREGEEKVDDFLGGGVHELGIGNLVFFLFSFFISLFLSWKRPPPRPKGGGEGGEFSASYRQ